MTQNRTKKKCYTKEMDWKGAKECQSKNRCMNMRFNLLFESDIQCERRKIPLFPRLNTQNIIGLQHMLCCYWCFFFLLFSFRLTYILALLSENDIFPIFISQKYDWFEFTFQLNYTDDEHENGTKEQFRYDFFPLHWFRFVDRNEQEKNSIEKWRFMNFVHKWNTVWRTFS